MHFVRAEERSMLATNREANAPRSGVPVSISINNLTDFDEDLARARRALGRDLPFVEVLWDNYCHVDPEELGLWLTEASPNISLHVMWSRFLERDQSELEPVLQRLAEHVRVLRPQRVSDHLCQFSVEGLLLGHGLELVPKSVDVVARKIDRYQSAIGQPLLLENFASTSFEGAEQVELLGRLARLTGCGVLFDVSNAVVAEKNEVRRASDWRDLLRELGGTTGHIGGFVECRETGLVHDSHGHRLAGDALGLASELLREGLLSSLCYEREHAQEDAEIAADLSDLKRCAS
jgi:uncharacterized protein (UPF0276 family)